MVVGFGGGVAGNVAGMVAALLFRGIRLVHVPTTTMAAMDSVLSMKQAVNSRSGKNHIGSYYPPTAVYLDIEVLRTLPDRHLRSGLCEAAKNGLAIRPSALPALRELLAGGDFTSTSALQWLLEESVAAKSLVTARDGRERGAGLALEYGHTIGHAIELCDQRRRGVDAVTHGEAVAIGLVASARIAAALGVLGREQVMAHERIVAALGVDPRLPPGVEPEDVMAAVRADNKRGLVAHTADESPLVLLQDLGVLLGRPECPLVPVPIAAIEAIVAGLALQKHSDAAVAGGPALSTYAHQVWSDALGCAVGPETDFFDVGGTSLNAMQVLTAFEAEYGLRLPLRIIYDHSRFDGFLRAVTDSRTRLTTQQAFA